MMSLNEIICHMIEDYAIIRTKQQICFNPFLTNRQKHSLCNALNLYSDAKKLHLCLKLLQ